VLPPISLAGTLAEWQTARASFLAGYQRKSVYELMEALYFPARARHYAPACALPITRNQIIPDAISPSACGSIGGSFDSRHGGN
jgi:hypothetical protein